MYDIETANWTTFVCGCVYVVATGEVERYGPSNEDAMAERLFAFPGEAWAHNAGRFDVKWVVRHALKRGLVSSLALAGSRVIRMQSGKTVFKDSKAIFPISLKDLTSLNRQKKYECPIPFSEFAPDMEPAKLEQVLDYCAMDCKSLSESLATMEAYGEVNDLDFGTTVGGSAWRNVRRLFGVAKANFTMNEHKTLRRAYYGGRVEVFNPSAWKVWEYDINSAYPDALARTALPVGDWRWIRSPVEAAGAFQAGLPGAYCARVNVPKGTHVPPLPCRAKGRLVYPTGQWLGWFVQPELEYAKSLGVDVQVVSACVFDNAQPVLKEWCQKIWDLRKAVIQSSPLGKKDPLATILKFYANSLTGKLGQRPARTKVHIHPISGPRRFWEEVCLGLPVYSESKEALDDCCHVLWSAYLTAATRIKLHQKIVEKNDGRDACYCDTDGVLVQAERDSNIGPELGQFEKSGPFFDYEGISPKMYRYTKADGKHKVRAKGFRIAQFTEGLNKPTEFDPADYADMENIGFELIKRGKRFAWRGVAGLLQGLRRKKDPFAVMDLSRQVLPTDGWVGGRILDPESPSGTRAPHVENGWFS